MSQEAREVVRPILSSGVRQRERRRFRLDSIIQFVVQENFHIFFLFYYYRFVNVGILKKIKIKKKITNSLK